MAALVTLPQEIRKKIYFHYLEDLLQEERPPPSPLTQTCRLLREETQFFFDEGCPAKYVLLAFGGPTHSWARFARNNKLRVIAGYP
jgi:hypothetical protein